MHRKLPGTFSLTAWRSSRRSPWTVDRTLLGRNAGKVRGRIALIIIPRCIRMKRRLILRVDILKSHKKKAPGALARKLTVVRLGWSTSSLVVPSMRLLWQIEEINKRLCRDTLPCYGERIAPLNVSVRERFPPAQLSVREYTGTGRCILVSLRPSRVAHSDIFVGLVSPIHLLDRTRQK